MSHQPYHIPALLPEALEMLDIRPSGIYIDATFGGGGHSRGIAERLGPEGHLYSFDRDLDAAANVLDTPVFTFVHSNFRYIENFMRFHGVDKVDGILADLGVSFHHFDTTERGFSFRTDAPLDMRMNTSGQTTAAELIASASAQQLKDIFRQYTDLKRPGSVADAIVAARGKAPVDTTFRLVEAVSPAINPRQEKKELAQVFQALRITVNDEMGDLKAFLQATERVLRPGGRLVVLTYHSVEDRIVKNFMRSGNTEGREEKDFYGRSQTPWEVITRRPIEPGEAETEANPRARSAKLRAAIYRKEAYGNGKRE